MVLRKNKKDTLATGTVACWEPKPKPNLRTFTWKIKFGIMELLVANYHCNIFSQDNETQVEPKFTWSEKKSET